MRRVFGRVRGIRVWLRWEERRSSVEVEPDEDDLESAAVADVVEFWSLWGAWADNFAARNPGWSVNGVSAGDEAAVIDRAAEVERCESSGSSAPLEPAGRDCS